jgi:hypothetical protein
MRVFSNGAVEQQGSQIGHEVLGVAMLVPLVVIVFGSAMLVTALCGQHWRTAAIWFGAQAGGWLLLAGLFMVLQRINGNRTGLRGWWRWQQGPKIASEELFPRIVFEPTLPPAQVRIGVRVPEWIANFQVNIPDLSTLEVNDDDDADEARVPVEAAEESARRQLATHNSAA